MLPPSRPARRMKIQALDFLCILQWIVHLLNHSANTRVRQQENTKRHWNEPHKGTQVPFGTENIDRRNVDKEHGGCNTQEKTVKCLWILKDKETKGIAKTSLTNKKVKGLLDQEGKIESRLSILNGTGLLRRTLQSKKNT